MRLVFEIVKAITIMTALFFLVFNLFLLIPIIQDWERENNFPYGRMCDPHLFNLWKSTCQ